MDLLIETEDINVGDQNGQTPLFVAVDLSNLNINKFTNWN